MPELFIFIFCTVKNYTRAKAAQLNAGLWAFYTFISIFIAWVIGLFIVTLIMLYKDATLREMLVSEPENRQKIMAYVQAKDLMIPYIFVAVSAFGGYLLVRHLIISRTKTDENVPV